MANLQLKNIIQSQWFAIALACLMTIGMLKMIKVSGPAPGEAPRNKTTSVAKAQPDSIFGMMSVLRQGLQAQTADPTADLPPGTVVSNAFRTGDRLVCFYSQSLQCPRRSSLILSPQQHSSRSSTTQAPRFGPARSSLGMAASGLTMWPLIQMTYESGKAHNERKINVTLSEPLRAVLRNNGTLYAHAVLCRAGRSPDPASQMYSLYGCTSTSARLSLHYNHGNLHIVWRQPSRATCRAFEYRTSAA